MDKCSNVEASATDEHKYQQKLKNYGHYYYQQQQQQSKQTFTNNSNCITITT